MFDRYFKRHSCQYDLFRSMIDSGLHYTILFFNWHRNPELERKMLKRILLAAALISVFPIAGLIHAFQSTALDPSSGLPIVDKNQTGSLPAGFIAASDPDGLPLPVSGYRIYLVGESHGNLENETVFLSYLSRLYRDAGLRDVVIEEDQAYDDEAKAFVQGKSTALP